MIAEAKSVILNKNDYIQIKKNISADEIQCIRLFDFKDWEKTKRIVDKLTHELGKGGGNPWDVMYEIRSRIKDYADEKQSAAFLVFLLSFVAIIFFLASNIMLHFKLLTEFEIEKVKYKKLYKIGITKKEVTLVVSKELRILFLLPVLLGMIIACFYNYYLSLQLDLGSVAVRYSLLIGLAYMCLQILSYLTYRRYYINKLFDF